MICPRCEKDTVLFVQRITSEKRGIKAKEVFICDPCKNDWISTSALFRMYWKKTHVNPTSNQGYEFLYSLFLKENERYGKSDRRKFAQAAVAVIGGPLGKREAIFIPDADLLTNEDYAWAAGVIDARSTPVISNGDPQKACLSISCKNKDVLDRMTDLVGGRVLKSNKAKDSEYWTFTTTKQNSENLLKRVEPYLKCSRKNHPTELSDDDRTLAWLAGFIQASSDNGVKTRCEWAAKVLGTFFEGEMSSNQGLWTFYPGEGAFEKLKIFIYRKLDPAGAQSHQAGSIPREAGRLPYPVGEGIALGIPKGSHRELSNGPKPNSVAGFTPAGEGGQIGLVPKVEGPPPPSVWDPTPEIQISEKTLKILKLKNCFLCKKIIKDLDKNMILKGTKDMPLLGKLKHLYSELGIEPKAECPECRREVPLRLFTDDFLACEACHWDPSSELPDDKKWATV